MKVAFCTQFLGDKPYDKFVESLVASVKLIEEAGYEHFYLQEVNCPYISAARAKSLRNALDKGADIIIFLDYDVAWKPEDLLTLIKAEGDVVSGTYRKKIEGEPVYMGTLELGPTNLPIRREDGALQAYFIPAGFLKITREGANRFAREYPELLFGETLSPSIDLFNHGAIDNVWYGEDYAFSKRWREKCGKIWLLPDLDIDHYRGEECYAGNFHKYLLEYTDEKETV